MLSDARAYNNIKRFKFQVHALGAILSVVCAMWICPHVDLSIGGTMASGVINRYTHAYAKYVIRTLPSTNKRNTENTKLIATQLPFDGCEIGPIIITFIYFVRQSSAPKIKQTSCGTENFRQ